MKARIGHCTRRQTDMVGAGLWRNHWQLVRKRWGCWEERKRAAERSESGSAYALEADCPSWTPSSALY